MNDTPQKQSILDAIKSRAVNMRPKWRFMLEHAGLATAIVLVVVGLVYLGSFLFFLWRTAQFSALPAFGTGGYRLFVRVFPWWQLVFVVLGAIALVYLLRRHTKVYRWPGIVMVGGVVLALAVSSWAATQTPLHGRLTNRVLRNAPVPLIGGIYYGRRSVIQGLVTPGVVQKVTRGGFLLSSPGGEFTVHITDDTRIPPGWEPGAGDTVVVIGQRDGATIEAEDIRFETELPNRPPFRHQMMIPIR